MRIASLLPAATEWVYAFGAEADLVGRSHACDYPPSVHALPVLTRPAFSVEADPAMIDAQMHDRVKNDLSLYDVAWDRLRALAPDLILTQAQCKVCAVALPDLEAALATWAGGQPQVYSLAPYTFKQVLDAALRLGKKLGRMEAAMRSLGEAEAALSALRQRLGLHKRADPSVWPTVACIEWMEPLMTAGHWMPDLIAMAGGRSLLADQGAPSTYIAWDALRAADPDVLVVAPCGFTLEQTRRAFAVLTERQGWKALKAVRQNRVFLFDGTAYFNRPGPRLYRSVELLAAALHPEAMTDYAVEAWEMQRLA